MLIKEILSITEQKGIKSMSFDIFDTVLFRLARIPTEIFAFMYDENPEFFPAYTDRYDFVNARQTAEKIAREKKEREEGHREVFLHEIYKELSTAYSNPDILMDLELRTEGKHISRNEEVFETICALKEKGLDLFLISDMYLNKTQIISLLQTADVDPDMFTGIYVSCEYSKSKTIGTLFEVMLKKNSILAEQLLHVGDNYWGDVGSAKSFGIYTYHYDTISNGEYFFPYFEIENQMYRNEGGGRIQSLRLLASRCIDAEHSSEEDSWYNIGANVMGPFLTYATEWILDEADRNKIRVIRPLMREGKVITKLLRNAAKSRNLEYDINPIYVSRLSIFSAGFDRITAPVIENILDTTNMKIQDAFEILGIPDLMDSFEKYGNEFLNNALLIVDNGENIKDKLLSYLQSERIMRIIQERNEGSSNLLFNYLTDSLSEDKAMTVDFGWRGSIQYEMDRCLERGKSNKKLLHLMYISKPDTINNVRHGTEIRGFLGNWGSADFEIKAIFARFLELFFYCEEGTTIGYVKDGERVMPKTKLIPYKDVQRQAMIALQNGIFNFQRIYLKEKERHPDLQKKNTIKQDVCDYMLRLCSYPTKKEAELIGKLEYDQNFGADVLTPIISYDELKLYKDFDSYYSVCKTVGASWNSGINVSVEPEIYLKNIFLLNRKYKYLSLILMCRKAIRRSGMKKLALVGAGENGKMMVKLFAILGSKMPCVIFDNNESIKDSDIGRIPIRSINADTLNEDYFYIFSVTGKSVCLSLIQQIQNIIGSSIDHVSYFEEMKV